MKVNILLILLLFSCTKLLGQLNCEKNLNEARANYASGNLYAIPGKLTECIENGFSKTEKIQAYQLLALTYLNINQQEKAREAFVKLLKLKTDYQVLRNVDPPELYSLYRKIDTNPIYFVGLVGGLNYNLIQTIKRYSLNPVNGMDTYNYKPVASVQIGGQFTYPLLKYLWLRGDVLFQNQKYNYNDTIPFSEDNLARNIYRFESSNNGINISLSARAIKDNYSKDNYSFKPFFETGITGRYNINYEILNYSSTNSESPNAGEADLIDMKQHRNTFNIGVHAYIGSMIKIGEYYGEVKFGVTKYFLEHTNYAGETDRYNKSVGNFHEVVEDEYTNLVLELNVAFNMPFFNFK